MTERIRLNLGWVLTIFVFCLCSCQAIKSKNVLTQSDFYQTQEPTGEFMFQFDKDEIFHVDLDRKETRWRLPVFGEVASFEAAGALQEMSVLKYNLDICKEQSNYTKAKNVAPKLFVYPEEPVILGEPNTLICGARQFFPPVTQMSWMKNSEPVSVGVSETDFYPALDGSFSKFLYLVIVPREGEVYTCSVVHPGQTKNPTNKFWRPEVSKPVAETSQNLICGLGLFIGICGIITGIALICKGMKDINSRRGQ